MPEFRTQPLDRTAMLSELATACMLLAESGNAQASVSFGWDSNLPIEEMWIDQVAPVVEVTSLIAKSESDGVTRIGKSDIFVQCSDFLFTMCHEGDVHVSGQSPLVQEFFIRWAKLGYSPYEVSKPDA